MKLPESLPNGNPNPRGNLLQIKHLANGHSIAVLDNGISNVVSIMCHTETLAQLLDADLKGIVAHLHSREKGHFRTKRS